MKSGLFYLFDTLGEMEPGQFYKEALEETQYGEELGFWATCPAEHHFSEHYGIMPRVEHFLSYVAGGTSKIKLWPMVIVAPLGHPVRLAEDCALIDQMSGGRLVFSVGSGYRKYEFKTLGQPIEQNADRLREITDLTVRLWTEDAVSHEGEYYRCNKVTLQPKPFQKPHPPVYLTTTREDQIKWAAERGYGIVPAAGFNASTLKHDYDRHTQFALAAGQAPMEIRPFFKWIYVHEDHETAVQEGTQFIFRTLMAFAQGGGRLFSNLIGKSNETWNEDVEKPEWLNKRIEEVMAAGVTYEDMVESGWTPFVCGDPEHVAKVLQPFVDAGGNFFMGGFKCGPMPTEKVRESMRLYQEEVVPRLRMPETPVFAPSTPAATGATP
jgi:alkanesulfonate monooxygenase SsuD/methylene tetrahydromethanopterin reductase-like flavin-dependent oxidoreductase (luciferase family)